MLMHTRDKLSVAYIYIYKHRTSPRLSVEESESLEKHTTQQSRAEQSQTEHSTENTSSGIFYRIVRSILLSFSRRQCHLIKLSLIVIVSHPINFIRNIHNISRSKFKKFFWTGKVEFWCSSFSQHLIWMLWLVYGYLWDYLWGNDLKFEISEFLNFAHKMSKNWNFHNFTISDHEWKSNQK